MIAAAFFANLLLSSAATPSVPACSTCSDWCTLVPPYAHYEFPCYQGTPEDAAKCLATDPLLLSGTTWYCGQCATFGYSVYLQNDPIYVNMELWNYTNTYPSGCTCSNNTCTNIPSNNQYLLGSYCPTTVACTSSYSGNCQSYFIADSGRFGCGSKVTCCQGSSCLNMKVMDTAPSCATEATYGAPTVMGSSGVCKYFTGSTTCTGKTSVVCTVAATAADESDSVSLSRYSKIPLGPCSNDVNVAEKTNLPLCNGN